MYVLIFILYCVYCLFRKEIEMKISHTVTEAEVLLGQISELDHSLSLLRRHQPVPQNSDCLEQLSESLSVMKLEKNQELSRKTAEVKKVEFDLGSFETAALGMQQEWGEKIAALKSQFYITSIKLTDLEEKLMLAKEEKMRLKNKEKESLALKAATEK